MAALARTKPPKKTLAEKVDEFGHLKAQVADLEARMNALKEDFKDSGKAEIEGALFRVVVSRYTMSRVDWKSVAEALNPPASLIKRNTTPSDVCRIEAKAR